MKRMSLVKLGLLPLAAGVLFYLISYFTDSNFVFGLMSIAFVLWWSYIGHQVGKEYDGIIKNVIYAHFIPLVIVVIQIIAIIYTSLTGNYTPLFVSQLYFLPTQYLIFNFFSLSIETTVIMSFILIVVVFSAGLIRNKRNI